MPRVDIPDDFSARYNIAPTQQAFVISNDDPVHLQSMYWGLLPHWSKEGKLTGSMINARAESIADKASFRVPFKKHRCLVPADGFYEWKKMGKHKIPYRIHMKDDSLMMMAGVWDEWRGDGGSIRTFSIITTVPNREVSALHDRMPVLLQTAEAQQLWLEDTDSDTLQGLLKPVADGFCDIYRVSDQLNSPFSEGAFLHKEIPETPDLFSV